MIVSISNVCQEGTRSLSPIAPTISSSDDFTQSAMGTQDDNRIGNISVDTKTSQLKGRIVIISDKKELSEGHS